MKKAQFSVKHFLNVISMLLTTVCIGVCICGVIYKQYDYFGRDELLIGLSVLSVELMLLCYLSTCLKESDHRALLLIAIISVAVLSSWNMVFDAQPMSDYAVLWEGAHQIIDGSFYQRASDPTDYFSYYNFQIGYTFYLSILLRLFGSLNALKFVKITVITLTNLTIYKTFRLFYSIKKSFISTVIFVVFPYIFLGSGILNNQHESLLFISLAVYVYLSGHKYSRYVFSAILLSIGNILRPTCTVVLVALVFSSLLNSMISRKHEPFAGAIIQLIVFWTVTQVVNMLFIVSHLAPMGVKSENLWFKLILGLTGKGMSAQQTTDAIHTNLYYDLLYYDFDYISYQIAAKKHLMSLLKNDGLDYKWIGLSILNFLGGIDNQIYYGNESFVSTHWFLVNILNVMGSGIYTLSLVCSLLTGIRKRIMDNPLLTVTALIFGGYFLVYLLFEKQTRYRYEQYYALFLFGIPLLTDVLQRMIQKVKR